MRVILLKQASDFQDLTSRLLGRRPAGSSAVTLDHLKTLNPHVDFNRIEPGTVLLLPDTPDIRADDKDSLSPADDAFDDVVRHVDNGFQDAAAQIAKAVDELSADRVAIGLAAKTAEFKRLLESDPLLKKQLDAAAEASNAELKKVKEAAKQLEVLRKAAGEGLAALRQLLQ
jgi:hypothetical protein